MYKKMTRPKTI